MPSRSHGQPLGPLGRILGTGVLAVLLAMVLVALLAGSAWGAGASFGAPATYGVAQYPVSVALDDFNRDGNPDIVAAVAGIHGVDVLLGNPDGSFGTPMPSSAGGSVQHVTTGDFNGDGDPDLVVGVLNGPQVAVLFGGPGGSFSSRAIYPVSYNHGSLAVGDFNRDGHPDLAVAVDAGNDSIAILPGGPGGTLGPETLYPVGAGYVTSVAVGDFNRDGDPDLVTTNESSASVSVLLGGQGAGFGPATTYPAGSYPGSVAVADFNHDGDQDLVAANHQSDDVSVLLGGAGGSFGAQTRYHDAGNPVGVVAADFSLDGNPDLATVNYGSNAVAVLPGGPLGGFGSATSYPVGSNPHGVAAGDFNGDDAPDLVVANTYSASLSVLLNATGLDLSPREVAFPSTVVGEDSASRTLVLKNPGPNAVTVSDVSVIGADAASFATVGNTCTGAVAADGSCSVTVRFRPTSLGAKTASLRFTDTAPGSPQSVALSGTGISAASLSQSSIAFASRPDHTDSPWQAVTLTNVGTAPLAVSGLAMAGTDAGSFPSQAGTCAGATLSTGQSCSAQVRFRPLGTGAKTAALRISDSAVDSPQSVQLSGTGTPGPWLEPSVQALKFGRAAVGTTTAPKIATLTNVGSAPLQITDVAKGGTNLDDFRGLTQTCTTAGMLNPGDSCTASIAFRPTAPGARSATLTFKDTAPRNPHHVGLYGTGT